MLTDGNAIVVANALAALTEISTLSGENHIKLRSKTLKRVLPALGETNEWGQVYILDALTMYTPKKNEHAEQIIESVLPRLSHANPSVQMSAVKVVLKFLDWIENVEKVRNYCKKLSNSLMTVMMAAPEIQYVLLRSLHAIVQKRPYLLDKDFKYFYVQYNDPIYVKLEKIEILYKLADSKNFENIINELKSYAIMEFDSDLVKKVIKYIGCICFKYEKSLELCVESMKEILDHNQENTLSEGIIVVRDIMRKYKGVSLDLLKKIDEQFVNSLQDAESKAAVLYIIGEFCSHMKNSLELVAPFIENFNTESPSVKLQILNCVIKNYVNKPDEAEDMIKVCLQKGGEESENPDVRDRAYIYWRLLETEPDVAKEMVTSKKPPFEYKEEIYLEVELLDNIIENMTNISAIYHKTNKEMIPKEDMVIDETEESQADKDEKTGDKVLKSGKDQPKINQPHHNGNDADLLGLEDENASPSHPHVASSANPNMDIFDIFGNSNIKSSSGNINPDDFGFVYSDTGSGNNSEVDPKSIDLFNRPRKTALDTPQLAHKSGTLVVYSLFRNENSKVLLGLYIINKSNSRLENFQIALSGNSFGLSINSAPNSSFSVPANSADKIIYQVDIDNSNNDKKPPSHPYKILARIRCNTEDENVSLPLNFNSLLVDSGRMHKNNFVEFFKANTNNSFNLSYVINNVNVSDEDSLTQILEQNNIFKVANNAKADPPTIFYSCSALQVIPIIVECSISRQNQNSVKAKIISSLEAVIPLMKDVLDSVLSNS